MEISTYHCLNVDHWGVTFRLHGLTLYLPQLLLVELHVLAQTPNCHVHNGLCEPLQIDQQHRSLPIFPKLVLLPFALRRCHVCSQYVNLHRKCRLKSCGIHQPILEGWYPDYRRIWSLRKPGGLWDRSKKTALG